VSITADECEYSRHPDRAIEGWNDFLAEQIQALQPTLAIVPIVSDQHQRSKPSDPIDSLSSRPDFVGLVYPGPTPFQRDLSEAHVARVASAIDRLDRYLDPVIAVPAGDGKYWSPNGYHRLGAMRELGAKSIVALVVPEPEVAHRILLLNTEKAHNLRERALEVSRLAEALAALDDRPEREYETEFEEAALVTLGFCYQVNGRFSGGAYHSVLKRCDKFLAAKLPNALITRRERAARLLELNELVNDAVKAMKERGLESPYLKAFVVARINPLRFQRKPTADFDETIDKMIASARRFDSGKIRADQVARSGGPPAAEE
jgi:ParB family chromosome partitioning protein